LDFKWRGLDDQLRRPGFAIGLEIPHAVLPAGVKFVLQGVDIPSFFR
jgi:hypothetical protein